MSTKSRQSQTAFETAKTTSEKNGLNPIDSVKDAGDIAENAVRHTIDKMVDYDRKMRGKGFPKSVPEKNASLETKRSMEFIAKRKAAEIGVLTESAKRQPPPVAIPLKVQQVIDAKAAQVLVATPQQLNPITQRAAEKQNETGIQGPGGHGIYIRSYFDFFKTAVTELFATSIRILEVAEPVNETALLA